MILEKLCFQLMPDAHLGEAPQRAQMILRALGLSARVLTGDGDRPLLPSPDILASHSSENGAQEHPQHWLGKDNAGRGSAAPCLRRQPPTSPVCASRRARWWLF